MQTRIKLIAKEDRLLLFVQMFDLCRQFTQLPDEIISFNNLHLQLLDWDDFLTLVCKTQ